MGYRFKPNPKTQKLVDQIKQLEAKNKELEKEVGRQKMLLSELKKKP